MHRVFLFAVLMLFAVSGLAGGAPVLAQGVTYTDPMNSAVTGLLSTESSDPATTYAYQNGQYLVQAFDAAFEGELTSYLGVPEMASSRLTVDAAIAGDTEDKYVMAGCRAAGNNDGYAFVVFPGSGVLVLYRVDAGESVVLARMTDANLVNPGNANNQIGIDCWTGIMTGIINGEPVLSTFDDTYAFGQSYIGAGAGGTQSDGLTVGFDNLTVTDNGNLALGSEDPTPPVVPTLGAPPLAETGQMAPIRDPHIDPDGTLSDAFAVSLGMSPVVNGLSAADDVDIDSVTSLRARVQLADFYTELYFPTPSVEIGTDYLFGFCFWSDPAGNCYDIYVRSANGGLAEWYYGYDPVEENYQTIDSGTMRSLPPGTIDPTIGATNFLSLMVYRGVAILSGNTFSAAAVIPLRGTPIAGDVKAEMGFLSTTEAGATSLPLPMSFSDFAVWDLSSGLVPVSNDAPAALVTTGLRTFSPLQASGVSEVVFERRATRRSPNRRWPGSSPVILSRKPITSRWPRAM